MVKESWEWEISEEVKRLPPIKRLRAELEARERKRLNIHRENQARIKELEAEVSQMKEDTACGNDELRMEGYEKGRQKAFEELKEELFRYFNKEALPYEIETLQTIEKWLEEQSKEVKQK